MFTINTNHPGVNLVHKLNSLRRVEKLHPIKSSPMFFEAPQTEWREPFDFPQAISRVSMFKGSTWGVT